MASKFRKLAVGGIAATLGAGFTTYMLLKEDSGHMFVSNTYIILLSLVVLFFLVSGRQLKRILQIQK